MQTGKWIEKVIHVTLETYNQDHQNATESICYDFKKTEPSLILSLGKIPYMDCWGTMNIYMVK